MDMDTWNKNAALFTKMWMDVGSKMMTAGLSFNPMSPPADNARQMRNNIFGVMSDYAEEFMRSPQFLQFMKQSMDSTNGARQQLNEFMTGLRHDTQGTAREDIDSLMVNVRQLSRRVLDRFDELDARLDEISARLDESNGNGRSNGSAARAANVKPASARQRPPRRKTGANRAQAHEKL